MSEVALDGGGVKLPTSLMYSLDTSRHFPTLAARAGSLLELELALLGTLLLPSTSRDGVCNMNSLLRGAGQKN
jgi:hypothetical protein